MRGRGGRQDEPCMPTAYLRGKKDEESYEPSSKKRRKDHQPRLSAIDASEIGLGPLSSSANIVNGL
jgi:hypothetical protein